MLSIVFSLLKWAVILLVVLTLLIAAFLYFAPQFGANPKGAALERVKASENYGEKGFKNLVATEIDTREPGVRMGYMEYLFPSDDKNPNDPLPSQRFIADSFVAGEFVWFGHSTILFKTDKLTVLADPVFYRASPLPLPIVGKPFATVETPVIDDLPDIDVVIISHDHYDHLDSKTIAELSSKVKTFLVPLGIQPHLEHWGVPAEKIVELDWYQDTTVADTQFTLTPTRHFSGRNLTNRNSTLWGSWVIKSAESSVYFSGDSGYFDEFKKIGDAYGPFDIAFIENGAYNEFWSQIHMTPEQSVQAAIDLKAELYFPIHWGKFDLAKHKWTEPVERAIAAAEKQNLQLVAPLVGQKFTTARPPFEAWWK